MTAAHEYYLHMARELATCIPRECIPAYREAMALVWYYGMEMRGASMLYGPEHIETGDREAWGLILAAKKESPAARRFVYLAVGVNYAPEGGLRIQIDFWGQSKEGAMHYDPPTHSKDRIAPHITARMRESLRLGEYIPEAPFKEEQP